MSTHSRKVDANTYQGTVAHERDALRAELDRLQIERDEAVVRLRAAADLLDAAFATTEKGKSEYAEETRIFLARLDAKKGGEG